MINEMYRKFDEDGSGEIEYDEFAAFADATLDEEVEMTKKSEIEPKVKIHTLNPKAIPSTQLYGNFNPNTQEWDNGVLAVIYRNCVADTTEDRNWIVFDGPVDAVWIEDMNTVLDDNKKLCLMSGEIIKMTSRMTMMFEAEDLDQASPATVSRVGMVFAEPERLGVGALLQSWIESEELPPTFQQFGKDIKAAFEFAFRPAVFFARTRCKIPTAVSDMELAGSLLKLLGAQILSVLGKQKGSDASAGSDKNSKMKPGMKNKANNEKDAKKPGVKKSTLKLSAIEGMFIMALTWSVGAVVDGESRPRLDEYLRRLLQGRVIGDTDHGAFLEAHPDYAASYEYPGKLTCDMPDPTPEKGVDKNKKDNLTQSTLFEASFDPKGNKGAGSWSRWSNSKSILKYTVPKGCHFSSIIVPTVDTVRNEWLIDTLVIKSARHLLLVGPTGTGKTLSIKSKLSKNQLDSKRFVAHSIGFSARTSENQTQDIIDGKMSKRRKGVYGPPVGKRGILFVDDLNMPAKETYGAQPPIELLRQWMDMGGWYDRSSKEKPFRHIVDLTFIAAMGPPGGARSEITQRYMRHFNVVNVAEFSGMSLRRIFGVIINTHSAQNEMPGGAKQSMNAVIQATLDLFEALAIQMRPTPKKSHYIFNLRDLSNIFQGILDADPTFLKTNVNVSRLWVHECLRVFSDRLIDNDDRDWLRKQIGDIILPASFKLNWKNVVEVRIPSHDTDSEANDNIEEAEHAKRKMEPLPPLLFGSFADTKKIGDQRQYIDLGPFGHRNLINLVQSYLGEYNMSCSDGGMDLVLFMYCVEHVVRVCRVLGQIGGNALLVGVGGSGRKSVTALAAFMSNQKLEQIELTKSYGFFEWREDLKRIVRQSGLEDQETVFQLSDTQLVDEVFVEDINNLLNTGEVPNLFPDDEMVTLIEELTSAGLTGDDEEENGDGDGEVNKPTTRKSLGEERDPREIYNAFVRRSRRNLHVVLCFSPIGDTFRTRLRMFPSLVNCCYIDWFTEWPEEGLRSVAERLLTAVDLKDEERKGVVNVCVDMQSRVTRLSARFFSEVRRHYYVTPTSYLEMLSTLIKLLDLKRNEISASSQRYSNGLTKLQETAESVEVMKADLIALQPKLVIATKETDELLVKIAAQQEEANAKKKVVQAEETVCERQAEESKAIAQECEENLREALPALAAATAALSCLKKSDMDELKSMKSPPGGVRLTMEAVCILMNVKPEKIKDPNGGFKKVNDYWGPSKKKLLGDTKFIKKLLKYKKDEVPEKIVNAVAPYTKYEEFKPEVIIKASGAAAGLCKWVHAIYKYVLVSRMVAPKRAMLAKASSELAVLMEELEGKRATVRAVEAKIESLMKELSQAEATKTRLAEQVIDCKAKLERAEKLMTGLGGERSRWEAAVANLAFAYKNVVGDILLSSGIVAYLGAFTSNYRTECLKAWSILLNEQGLDSSAAEGIEGYSIVNVLSNAVQVRSWTLKKLPNDKFSIENAIILSKSSRWPLMIDPQGQANRWIRNLEGGDDSNSGKGKRGKKKLISEDESTTPTHALKVVKQNQSDFLRIVENAVQFGHPLLIENLPEALDPVLDPLLQKKITYIGSAPHIQIGDSQVPFDKGFRLYLTTKLPNPHYSPDICVMLTVLNFQSTMAGLTDQMLGLCVQMEAPDLEKQSENLMLEDAQNKAELEQIEDTILKLLDAAEGNILDDDNLIETLSASKATSDKISEKVKIAKRVKNHIDAKRTNYVPTTDPAFIDSHLLRFFLVGNTSLSLEKPNPAGRQSGAAGKKGGDSGRSWLTDDIWGNILALSRFPGFEGFDDAFAKDLSIWKGVSDSVNPLLEISKALDGNNTNTNKKLGFRSLCVLRCIRPDKVVSAVQLFIEEAMGNHFVDPPAFDLGSSFEESNCSTPIIFVLSTGADPTADLLKLAEKRGYSKRLETISLGQGQGPLAANATAVAIDNGGWVCLQNCHLSVSWLPDLERICEGLSPEFVHPEFRLWLTTLPCNEFPVPVLQASIKITKEPPKGIRASLLGSYLTFEAEWFESSDHPHAFKYLLYSLCFFHASIIERSKFGPLGWNIPYEFSESDRKICIDQLKLFIDAVDVPGLTKKLQGGELMDPEAKLPTEKMRGVAETLPFPAIRYLAGECNYGGRVTDAKDRRTLNTILEDFYQPNVIDDYTTEDGTNEHQFSVASDRYGLPKLGWLQNNCDHIRSLPLVDDGPEMFGLHANANISCALQETSDLLETALSLQPSETASSDGMSWDEQVSELASKIEARIPSSFQFDVGIVALRYPVMYEESMNTVLQQELLRFNNLLGVVNQTLIELQKAIKGLVLLSGDLEAMGNAMINGTVPVQWSAVSYPSLKPLGGWVSDLVQRLDFFKMWIGNGPPPVYWLPGFFFTQSFITGTRQNYARRSKIPIDEIDYDFQVLRRTPDTVSALSGDTEQSGVEENIMPEWSEGVITSGPNEGCYVNGLFLQGAAWNPSGENMMNDKMYGIGEDKDQGEKRCAEASTRANGSGALMESKAKELFVSMPVIWFWPRRITDIEVPLEKLGGTAPVYICPVYKTSERRGMLSTTGHSTNFVIDVSLPVPSADSGKLDHRHWCKRGVAMLTACD
eukprot:g2765.t1